MRPPNRTRGVIFAELIVSMTVLGALLVCTALTLDQLRRFNREQWLRCRCVALAEAQLDAVALTGQPLPATVVDELWPDLDSEVEVVSGQGAWAGCRQVRVRAKGQRGRRRPEVTLMRYVLPGQQEGRP